jgi:hypothetical protein
MATDAAQNLPTDEQGRWIVYHIVDADPPTADDFLSNAAKGRSPRRPLAPEEQELWRGISAYESWALARRKAGRSPWLGAYVAELRIPPGSGIQIRRTTSSRGHWTLWGDPNKLLACVVSVTPMRLPRTT